MQARCLLISVTQAAALRFIELHGATTFRFMCLLSLHAIEVLFARRGLIHVLNCYVPFRREDAAKAIDKLDGYGYDNLILRVEWAQPRAER